MPFDRLPFIQDSPYEWKPMLLALGTTVLNVTRMKRKLIVSEGGGTRGYASLSMLQFLMDLIKEIETSERPHAKLVQCMVDDPDVVADWTSRLSSFGPVLEQLPAAPPLLRKRRMIPVVLLRSKRRRASSCLAIILTMSVELVVAGSCPFFVLSPAIPACGNDGLKLQRADPQCHRLIALMLGRLRMSVVECLDPSRNMAQTVFGHKQRFAFGGLAKD